MKGSRMQRPSRFGLALGAVLAALSFPAAAQEVVLKGVAHGWSNVSACGAAFVADFVSRASVEGLDVGCAERSSAPPFVIR